MKKVIICLFFLCSLPSFLLANYTPYFTYTPEDLHSLWDLRSNHTMSNEELRKWDYIACSAIDENKLNFYDQTRMLTYLYVAQAESAFLSYTASGELSGSLDPISDQVLSLFLSNYSHPSLYQEDAYSQALAKIVLTKIEERIKKENALTFAYVVPKQDQITFSAGLESAKWIPWCAKPSIAYWPPPPPNSSDPVWKEQILIIKNAQTPMTEEKKLAIYRWAGLAYPWSNDWRSIVNAYLFCHHIPLQKNLEIRSVVMIGLYDSVIAYVGCKYHYLVVRPQVYDPTVIYEIPVPKHPSYPSGHSTESTLTATIMSFYFPIDAEYWHHLALQCCLSRIWAGIHYPLDDLGGRACGRKVAQSVLERCAQK